MRTSRLLINESPLMVMPSLAKTIGINEAVILQQIHYWLNPDHNKNYYDNKHWVYNSYDDWLKQFKFMSKSTLRRAIAKLESFKILFSQKVHSKKSDHTKWYTIDYDKLNKFTEEQIFNISSNNNQPLENVDMSKLNRSRNTDVSKMNTSRNADVFKMSRSRCVQNEQIDVSKLNTSYIEQETTTKTTKTISLGESQNDLPFKDDVIQFEKILDIWEKRIGEKIDDSKIANSARSQMLGIFRRDFRADFNEWDDYCKKISSSKFLMGELNSYKLNIFDAFKEKFIGKILNNCYGIGDRPVMLTYEEKITELRTKIKDRSGKIPDALVEALIEINEDSDLLVQDRALLFYNKYGLSEDSKTLQIKALYIQLSAIEQYSDYLLNKFKKHSPAIEFVNIYS
jgi:hypothetical protein